MRPQTSQLGKHNDVGDRGVAASNGLDQTIPHYLFWTGSKLSSHTLA